MLLRTLAAALLLAPAALAQTGFSTENAVPGRSFAQPVDVIVAPDGALFVVEKRGTVQAVRGGVVAPQPVLDLRSEVVAQGDRGLLGFALDPAFTDNGFVYALWATEIVPGQNPDNRPTDVFGRLARFQIDPATGRVDPASRTVLLGATPAEGIPACFYSHGPNTLRFGSDGTLLLSAGDGAQYTRVDDGGAYPNCFGAGGFPASEDIGSFRSQSLESLSGKILRLDPATGEGVPSNPFWTGDGADNASRVWAYGLRNPYRFSVAADGSTSPDAADPGTITIGEVGWRTYEELNVSTGGENFGWPCREGPVQQPDGYIDTPLGQTVCGGPFDGPAAWFHHSRNDLSFPQNALSNAIVAGDRYPGGAYPEALRGMVFHSDYTRGWVSAARFDADGHLVQHEAVLTQAGPIVAMTYEPASAAMLLVHVGSGEILRLLHDGGTSTTPPGWTSQDVGPVAVAGSAVAVGDAIRVAGGGDAWGDADALHLYSRELAGDGALTARLASLSGADAWSKVGLSLRASDAPGATHVSLYATPGAGLHVQIRDDAGGLTRNVAVGDRARPVWLRLRRDGQTVSAFTSPDGDAWELATTVSVGFGPAVRAGLVATATDYAGRDDLAVGVFEEVSVEEGRPGGLPAPWASTDIGRVFAEGGATFSGDQFTVQGGGDLWGDADGFHFLHQPIAGDATVQARLVRYAAPRAWSKAGPMVRASTDPGAAHAALYGTFEAGVHLQHRPADGALTASEPAAAADAPVWLRLRRRGSALASATSADGVTWTPGPTVTVALPPSAEIGLAVSATDYEGAGLIGIATFSDVQVTADGAAQGELPWVEAFDDDGASGDAGDTAWTTARAGAPADAEARTQGGRLTLGASPAGALVWRSEPISLGDAAQARVRLDLAAEGVSDRDRLRLVARVDGGAPVEIGTYRGAPPASVELAELRGTSVQVEAIASVRTDGAAYALDAVSVVGADADVAPPPVELPDVLALRAYPNPTRGTVTLSLETAGTEAARLDVVDVLGRVVLRRDLPAGTAGFSLDLGALPSGLYVVRALGAESRQAATARVTVVR